MAWRRAINAAILWVLIAGALLFVLLLAGVGSGLLTKPTPYTPVGLHAKLSPGSPSPSPAPGSSSN